MMSSGSGANASHQYMQKHEKKKFFKKKFRDMKYNKKNEVHKWEENRQKYIMRKYQKELKKNKIDHNSTRGNQSEVQESSKNHPPGRVSALKSAQLELQRRKEEKQKAIEARIAKKKEIQEAIEKYKKRKAEKFKSLSKKTKRGQPVMKDRLKLLYEEIQQKVASENSS